MAERMHQVFLSDAAYRMICYGYMAFEAYVLNDVGLVPDADASKTFNAYAEFAVQLYKQNIKQYYEIQQELYKQFTVDRLDK